MVPRTAQVHGQRGEGEAGQHQGPEQGEEGCAAAGRMEAGADGGGADGSQCRQEGWPSPTALGGVSLRGLWGSGLRQAVPWGERLEKSEMLATNTPCPGAPLVPSSPTEKHLHEGKW